MDDKVTYTLLIEPRWTWFLRASSFPPKLEPSSPAGLAPLWYTLFIGNNTRNIMTYQKRVIDWSVRQECISCFRPMRPARATAADWPGTTIYSGRGKCSICVRSENRRARRAALPRPKGKNPTVAELAAEGHPCIEFCPKPANKRSAIW